METRYYIGIDVGGTSIKMGLCTSTGTRMGEIERLTPRGAYRLALESMEQMTAELLSGAAVDKQQLAGVGVGVPAFLDPDKGYIYETVNLGWKEVAFKQELEQRLGLPCFVDNDANTAAIGEMWLGAGKGARHLICVTVGTGVGGGLILNGDIYHGAAGLAGEIGHFTVKAENGRPCNCGRRGCLETEASATALAYYGRKAVEQGQNTVLRSIETSGRPVTAKDVLDAAQGGDAIGLQIVDQAGYYLGFALAQLANVLNPQKLVIGGGVSRAGDVFLKPVKSYFAKYALKRVSEQAEIVLASLGNAAGWLGAAWLVHRNLAKLTGGNDI